MRRGGALGAGVVLNWKYRNSSGGPVARPRGDGKPSPYIPWPIRPRGRRGWACPALDDGWYDHEGWAAAMCRKMGVHPSPRGVRFLDPDGVYRTPEIGEGGPRQALSPAVAGRMRGYFADGIAPTPP